MEAVMEVVMVAVMEAVMAAVMEAASPFPQPAAQRATVDTRAPIPALQAVSSITENLDLSTSFPPNQNHCTLNEIVIY
ncbi:unnamed protein product [Nezara viridula]|uniref:Uncharacterized protein n=1 Tax=Nezara viridula TaxID=85310 RepID=A0A9P0HR67_NEZVI|nr:unnamed protein product [Nezara viridula]